MKQFKTIRTVSIETKYLPVFPRQLISQYYRLNGVNMIHIDLWYTYIYTTQYIPTTDVSDVYQGMGKRHYLRVIRDARGRYVQFAYIWSYYTDNVKGWGDYLMVYLTCDVLIYLGGHVVTMLPIVVASIHGMSRINAQRTVRYFTQILPAAKSIFTQNSLWDKFIFNTGDMLTLFEIVRSVFANISRFQKKCWQLIWWDILYRRYKVFSDHNVI